VKVELWAYTTLAPAALDRLTKSSPQVADPDHLGEAAGRACYLSWNRPHAKTATNDGYMANILTQGHESVLEHASVSFYVTGVSRSLSHELVRHRHLSFSQQSQRYVDETGAGVVVPPAMRGTWEGFGTEADRVTRAFDDAADASHSAYVTLVDALVELTMAEGVSPRDARKRAREAARSVLLNATVTSFVVTGNLRAWRDVLRKRHHVAADAEIQGFAREVLRQLREIAPASVQDIQDEPYGSDQGKDGPTA
jgi:thymidylate synthase (FAD)